MSDEPKTVGVEDTDKLQEAVPILADAIELAADRLSDGFQLVGDGTAFAGFLVSDPVRGLLSHVEEMKREGKELSPSEWAGLFRVAAVEAEARLEKRGL